MQLLAAIIKPRRTRIAAILVDIDLTYPAPGAAFAALVQPIFPALPIMLLSPRIDGFSRSWATFDLSSVLPLINTDEIEWQMFARPAPVHEELPF